MLPVVRDRAQVVAQIEAAKSFEDLQPLRTAIEAHPLHLHGMNDLLFNQATYELELDDEALDTIADWEDRLPY